MNEIVVTRGNWQLVRRPPEQLREERIISAEIDRLGRKPREYAHALLRLVQRGSQTAELAWLKFLKQADLTKATDVPAALAAIRASGAVPVSLDLMAQWKVDSFGFIALELLLWIWRERTQPQRWRVRCLPNWPGYGRWRLLQPLFDRKSEAYWYRLAYHAFLETYPNPERLREFSSLVTAQASRATEGLIRNYIVNRIGQRFLAFSASLGQ